MILTILGILVVIWIIGFVAERLLEMITGEKY